MVSVFANTASALYRHLLGRLEVERSFRQGESECYRREVCE